MPARFTSVAAERSQTSRDRSFRPRQGFIGNQGTERAEFWIVAQLPTGCSLLAMTRASPSLRIEYC